MLPQLFLMIVAIGVLISNFHWLYILYSILGFYIIGVFGNSIGFHRYLTHQSFKVSKFWHYAFITLGSLTGQGSPIFWTAIHLHHHRNSDKENDVHSPIHGFWQSSLLWYVRPGIENVSGLIAPRSLYRDKFIRFIHDHYYKFYWGIGLLILLIDPYFFLFFFCIGGYLFPAFADDLGNYFFHSPKYGYVNFETKDNSRNVPLISYIILGGGWHNNHHHDPKAYRYGKLKSEIDIAADIIELIKT